MTGVSVTVAAVYYMFTLRISLRTQQLALRSQQHTLETRQSQLTMQLYQMMTNKEYLKDFNEIQSDWSWTDYEDFMKRYGPTNPEMWMKFATVGVAWEQIGILMKHGTFDPEMLYDQWGGFFRRFWEKIEPIVIGYNLENGGGFFEYAEDLYYFFHEAKRRDDPLFAGREKSRLEKRVALGLNQRPAYV